MIEQGIYDEDPAYIRATIYEKLFEKVPQYGYEHHGGLVDKEKFQKWIVENSFDLHHQKYINDVSDGVSREITYYIDRNKRSILMVKREIAHSNYEPEILSSENIEIRNKNPHKFDWISLYSCDQKEIESFKDFLHSINVQEDHKNRLFMLKATEYNGLELDSFPIRCDEMNLELNYGSKFRETHEKIVNSLITKKSGLYVFHGLPGCGKTSYIKYLTTIINIRKFIFVPNILVGELFSPKMVDKLYSFKNSVLVLEDAEICIFKRDGHNNELVSGILNITDGLLKDILNISVVVTFNAANVDEMDPALKRKGRLLAMYNFGLLAQRDAERLATHLNKKNKISKSCSLADIYNLDEETGLEKENDGPIGFGGFKR